MTTESGDQYESLVVVDSPLQAVRRLEKDADRKADEAREAIATRNALNRRIPHLQRESGIAQSLVDARRRALVELGILQGES